MSKKKLFVVSDVHSFYTIMKDALNKAGFDPNNENHWLIVCGDCFDRGNESKEMLEYLMSLERKVLIRGNHDDLLEELCLRGYAEMYDYSNGTAKTVKDLGSGVNGYSVKACCNATYNKLAEYRNQLVDYFETKNYIFVHGWIPCEVYYDGDGVDKPWYQCEKTYKYKPDWRESNDAEWESARWINGISIGIEGVVEPGKTIVCGHWHCSFGHAIKNGTSEFEYDAVWEPFYDVGIIAIDRCTVHTNKVNVLVLEDEFMGEEE